MSVHEILDRLYDIIFREFSHRGETGLMKIGNPGRDSPVVVTGNYTETVRRVRKALKGENVWLLVANSKGINVWCAASGGHLTHHDVISAIVTSGAQTKVDNHRLILPQLAATGIEQKKITDATGWTAVWGPARVEDLPAFVHQGHLATPEQRFMRFPLLERLEMALMWWLWMVLIGLIVFALVGGWLVGLAVSTSATVIAFGIFAALPWLNVKGNARWFTFAIFAIIGFAFGSAILWFMGSAALSAVVMVGIGSIIEMAAISVDLAGTTPWYGSYINTFRNMARIDLVSDRCDASLECLQVCPRDVFKMNGFKKKVEIMKGGDCIQCGACIVQCPRDALRFRYDDGHIVEPNTIRKTRMNMLGRRTIELSAKQDSDS